MTDKQKKITEEGVLKADMEQLMTPQAVKELGALSPTMQQFLLRWQDKRDMILGDQLKEELKEFLLKVYEADNDAMCKNIAEIVTAQNKKIFEVMDSQTRIIESIARDISTIKNDIINIKDRLELIENTVEEDEKQIKIIQSRCDERLERIEKIEQKVELFDMDLMKELIRDIEEARPKLTKLLKYSSPWSTSLRVFLAMLLGWAMTWLLMKYVWHLI